MADPATSSLLAGAASKLGNFVWDQLTKAAPDLLKKFKEKRAMEQAVGNYLIRYMDAYGSIKPIGMTHAIPLEQIYTEVQFTTEDLRKHFTEELIEITAVRDLRGSLNRFKIKKMDGISAANQFQRMLVVGNPGGGKSVYLQRIGWECLRSHGIRAQGHSGEPRYQPELLPVLLELKRCRSDEKASLVELLAREFADCGFPESVPMVEALLKTGKLLVLLDALDEVAQDRVEAVVQDAQSLIRRYPDCRFIISCRIAFRHDYFRDFRDVTLLEFSDEQISSFIHNWFCGAEQKVEKIAERFVHELHQSEHRATLELARSPVLLGYLCVGYQGTLQLSSNRAEIYRRALDIFLQEWNARNLKTAHTRHVHASLPPETELLMLAQIAYEALLKERFFLTKDEWLSSIRDFMADLVEKPKTLPVGEILDNIAVSQGLVVQRTHQDWSFSHLTLQEYLAAYHIDQHGLMEDCVEEHLGDERWQEVFLILAGMKPGPLLQAMVRVANQQVLQKNPGWKVWRTRLNAWQADSEMMDGYEYEREIMIRVAGVSLFLLDRFRASAVGHSSLRGAAIDFIYARASAVCLTFDLAQGLDPTLTIILANGISNDPTLTRVLAIDLNRARDLISCLLNFEGLSEIIRASLGQLNSSFDKKEPEALLPLLENPQAVAAYFDNLRLLLRCKKAGSQKLKASEWRQVLEQIF